METKKCSQLQIEVIHIDRFSCGCKVSVNWYSCTSSNAVMGSVNFILPDALNQSYNQT